MLKIDTQLAFKSCIKVKPESKRSHCSYYGKCKQTLAFFRYTTAAFCANNTGHTLMYLLTFTSCEPTGIDKDISSCWFESCILFSVSLFMLFVVNLSYRIHKKTHTSVIASSEVIFIITLRPIFQNSFGI